MRIILDGMGGDNAPGEVVKGAVEASKLIDDEICIVGREELIHKELKNTNTIRKTICGHAEEVIPMIHWFGLKEKRLVLVKGLNMLKDI
jgi:glycerol-3-phosphate acyltransferase PlsX